ncbi:hypothetical protein DM611_11580 [Stenotrophomonas maltophilia]|nr:hypothetical protein DM611_11580 [Stenotrophomonas maltophilia]
MRAEALAHQLASTIGDGIDPLNRERELGKHGNRLAQRLHRVIGQPLDFTQQRIEPLDDLGLPLRIVRIG